MAKAILSFSEINQPEVKFGVINTETKDIIQINSPFDPQIVDNRPIHLKDVDILPPVLPGKIVAIGLNYRDHAKEFNHDIPEEPLIFLKPPSALLGNNELIKLPSMSKRVDYEAELVIVIKETAKCISESEAIEHILGYTCGNDVTARDLQKKDGQWARAKSFDTFAPIGPWIIPAKQIEPDQLNIIAKKNGEVVQCSNTNQMIFNPYQLVSYISHIMTLLPGDLIMTGTPKGVGPLSRGDCIEIEIENIGTLKNYVADQ
jgi:2-keto-4-pentenoate hydratase/2-oxohepta-3-ene-1,7-dioic acid hydratase in catechol pathway